MKQLLLTSHESSSTSTPAKQQQQTQRKQQLSPMFGSLNDYLTLKTLLNILLVSVVIIEFYQPCNLFAEAKKSKKYVVVKEIGTTYKKVPVYKKVPMKVLKVVIKKKKAEKPWKKWFKKEMIVKIPKEKKHHHHHHAASEGHQTWALPAFISTPSSMSEIFEAWPNDYATNGNSNTNNNNIKQQPTSVSDLKSVGSEEYPAFLAAAAAQLVQHHLGYPATTPAESSPSTTSAAVAADNQRQQQQQQQQQAINEHIALTNLANLEQALQTNHQIGSASSAVAPTQSTASTTTTTNGQQVNQKR